MMEGPWCRFRREARARERHRHRSRGQSDVLDPGRPIREADIEHQAQPLLRRPSWEQSHSV